MDINNKMTNLNDMNFFDLDICLIEQLISIINYDIYIDEEYYDDFKIITNICNKYNKNINIKPKLQIICLLSNQRTGSTYIVDLMQKFSDNILALSEIFNGEYHNSYDVLNECGVLYGINLDKYIHLDDKTINNYFNQFIEISEFNNKQILLFKFTIDFFSNLYNINEYSTILSFIKNFNVIYLNRNNFECYISKIMAEKYGYANVEYPFLENNMFNYSNYITFYNNIKIFQDNYLSLFNNILYLNYNEINEVDNICEFINSKINKLLSSNKIYFNYYLYDMTKNLKNYVNIKQNKFDITLFYDKKYWIIDNEVEFILHS